jgi:DNA (cytosine-5)-methyltransferase 1
MPAFYEFFAGGGMARAGLGSEWKCLFANDFDAKKGASYAANWGDDHLRVEDVRRLTPSDLPGNADLVWASFPCQDLSLAGGGAGLRGDRSGTFWPFWNLIQCLSNSGRRPSIVALENVCGTLTSHGGKDFSAICAAFRDAEYRFGAIVVDANHFVPQSRPRVFIIAVSDGINIPPALLGGQGPWHSKALINAFEGLDPASARRWLWWNPPAPAIRNTALKDIVEQDPTGVTWHSSEETRNLLRMMTPANRSKIDEAKKSGASIVGTLYRRGRPSLSGNVQRAEVRFDGIAGCLRTPAGGSSRQVLVFVERGNVRSRLISPREAARLMGLPDSYELPSRYNEAYHLVGDGVVVPVVKHLREHIFDALLPKEPQRLVA